MMKRFGMLAAAMMLTALFSSAALAETVYNRGNAGDPESLDPHKTSTTSEAAIMRDMFEGLVMADAKAELIPGAAESWTVSGDGTVYTFKLRADAVWSNGDPVTAEDFVYSFRRLLDPKTAAEYASMLYVVKDGEAANTGKAKPEDIGVKAIDAKTLEVTLNAPTPYFLEMLTHQATYPINSKSIEALGDAWTKPGSLVSNGAFTLAEFVPNDHIKLVKNPKFHDAASVKLDVVNYIPAEDRATAMKRFEAGELDTNDDVPAEQLADLKAKFGDKVRTGPILGVYYYVVKIEKPPFDNLQVRRAISMAIDRDYLAEKVWNGTMFPAYAVVPPGITGYEPSVADYAEMSQIDREEEATKILSGLGYGPGNPLKLEIRYNTSENHKNTAIAIQEQLRAVGIEATILNSDGVSHFANMEQKGPFDLSRTGWIADYKDPESFLGISVSSSGNNYANFNNADFDRLMKEAAAAGGDPATRMKLLAQAEKITVDGLNNIPLLFYSFKAIISDKITGYEDNVMDVHPSRFISKAE